MHKIILTFIGLFIPLSILAAQQVIDVHQLTNDEALNGIGENVGTITLEDTEFGLLITPDLKQLSPGMHGFHVHANASCEGAIKEGQYKAGLSAGGHFDPQNTGMHKGPYATDGHLGDLPHLYCDMKGICNTPVLAPRLSVSQVKGHSIMVHVNGDNFSDTPAALGGGGARMACGVAQ